MKAHLRDSFTGLTDNESMKVFEQLLDLDDKKFAAISDGMMDEIRTMVKSSEFNREMLGTLKSKPITDPEKERESIKEFLAEIDDDDSLSPEKKEFLKMLTSEILERAIELQANPREKIDVKIEKLDDRAVIPTYAHPTDAGADVSALEDTVFAAGETRLVRTGLKLAIPAGYECQVRPRSGLSLKTGLRVANAPGTVDSMYRGELGVIITNTSPNEYTIKAGDKIAQLLIAPTPMINFIETTIDDVTDRGEGGFGSTG